LRDSATRRFALTRRDKTIRDVHSFTTRRGTVADVDSVGAIVQAGFESYREFAHTIGRRLT
jgi:hypothetical protein